MISSVLRRFRHRFTEPAFDRRRSFAGSLILTCRQTGEDYSIIPAGATGFYVAGAGGRYIAQAANHSHAAELIDRDARDAIRAFGLAA